MKGLRATGMRRSLGMLLALVAVARGFTPGMLPPLTRAAAARAPPPQLGPFTKVRTLFSSLRKSVKSEPETVESGPATVASEMLKISNDGAPTAVEIEEYCRDPESSGCDIEMVEALMAEAAKMKKKQSAIEQTRNVLDKVRGESQQPIKWRAVD